MSQQSRSKRRSRAVQTESHDAQLQANKPEFLFAARMGRESIEDIQTDLVLIPVLSGMKVPRDLRADSEEVGELIKQAIKDNNFAGKRGETLLVETSLPSSTGEGSRKLLLAGLGRADKFCARAAEGVFGALVDEACRLNAARVTIPFIPNRGTGACLNMKGMAHRMNIALNKRLAQKGDEEVSLTEVQIFCTPQAKPHIEQGLSIPVKLADSSDDC
ncbi:MAG: hypothetical protein K2X77_33485 [Candidatus Obscuribacterales bacterium]|nr:hypothetical protein [Candidatus Obscuribacterales bacterium]